MTEQHELMTIGEVCGRVRLAKPSIYRSIAAGKFPRPIKIGPKRSFWVASEIDAYIAARMAERVSL